MKRFSRYLAEQNRPDTFGDQPVSKPSTPASIDSGENKPGFMDQAGNFMQDNKNLIAGVLATTAGAAFIRPALNTIGSLLGKRNNNGRMDQNRDYSRQRQITKDNVKQSMQTAKDVTKPKKIGPAMKNNKPGVGNSPALTKLG